LCFFLRMRLRRFLISDPMARMTLLGFDRPRSRGALPLVANSMIVRRHFACNQISGVSRPSRSRGRGSLRHWPPGAASDTNVTASASI
jgi:hypothetical protein